MGAAAVKNTWRNSDRVIMCFSSRLAFGSLTSWQCAVKSNNVPVKQCAVRGELVEAMNGPSTAAGRTKLNADG